MADPSRVRLTVISVVSTGVPALKHLPASLRASGDRRAAAVDAAGRSLTDATGTYVESTGAARA